MTQEEAREILNILKEYERAYQYSKEEVVGALDMAIQALEQQFYKECDVEMAEDCISREAALEEACEFVEIGYNGKGIFKRLKELPSVQPQPKRGKWIFNENMHDYCCSECGCLMPNVNEYYRKKIIGCPYCLADMREVQDEQW